MTALASTYRASPAGRGFLTRRGGARARAGKPINIPCAHVLVAARAAAAVAGRRRVDVYLRIWRQQAATLTAVRDVKGDSYFSRVKVARERVPSAACVKCPMRRSVSLRPIMAVSFRRLGILSGNMTTGPWRRHPIRPLCCAYDK